MRATSWAPIGGPSDVKPAWTEIVGCPKTLTIAVLDTICVEAGVAAARPLSLRSWAPPGAPQAEAGRRSGPPLSAPMATGTMPVATATAEPPGERRCPRS